MKNTKLIAAIVAALGLVTVSHAGSAQNDLVIGFSSTDPSVTQDYEIDLGNVSNYTNLAANTTLDLSSHISTTDMSNVFGANWSSSNIVQWAAGAASPNTGTKASWATNDGGLVAAGPWTAGATPTSNLSNYSSFNGSNRVAPLNSVTIGSGLAGSLANLDLGTGHPVSSANTTNGGGLFTATIASATDGSWSFALNNDNSTIRGSATQLGTGQNITQFLNLGANQFGVINLFSSSDSPSSGAATYVGSFELSSTGSLFFTNFAPTVSAIPEPSTYAMILGLAALGFVMIRRRQAIA